MGVHLGRTRKGGKRENERRGGEPNLAGETTKERERQRERLADSSRDSSNGIGKYRGTYLTVTDRERIHRWSPISSFARARARPPSPHLGFTSARLTLRDDAMRYRTVARAESDSLSSDTPGTSLLFALHVPGGRGEARVPCVPGGSTRRVARRSRSRKETRDVYPRSLSTFTYTINSSNRTFFNRATVHPVRLLPPSRLLWRHRFNTFREGFSPPRRGGALRKYCRRATDGATRAQHSRVARVVLASLRIYRVVFAVFTSHFIRFYISFPRI